MTGAPAILLKRVYAPAEPGDGRRVLVDRLWPRGLSKDAAAVDEWLRDVAPTTALRQEFHRGGLAFDAFAERYRRELEDNAALDGLVEEARRGVVTLLYSARDEESNHARVLAAVLEQRLAQR